MQDAPLFITFQQHFAKQINNMIEAFSVGKRLCKERKATFNMGTPT
jgi:hypothetical protein